ncbi:hypothetical protein AX17_007434 [Amanita inopinata Kibby_2008]|nr:hypothetical protein AX17_007434 [Amanita inopinata Kibby_2008]
MLKLPLPPKERTRDVLESIVKSRKSWKAFKDGEVVWPPELEEALIEGLESYIPEDCRETRLLGRFPMRNRFISDYIYRKTGKRRTAKQVGSRLQQLRDTCSGKELLALISPYPRPRNPEHRRRSSVSSRYSRSESPSFRHDVDAWSDTSSAKSPITPTDTSLTSSDSPFLSEEHIDVRPLNVVFIDLIPERNDLVDQSEVDVDGGWPTSAPLPTNHFSDVNQIQVSQQPRHLRSIDPTITFVSRASVSAHSVFRIYIKDMIVSTEATLLMPIGASPSSDSWNDGDSAQLYSTTLAPGYWKTISNSSDPTQYSIEQKVYQGSTLESGSIMFAAIYKFRYPKAQQTMPGVKENEKPLELGFNFNSAIGYPTADPSASFKNLDYMILGSEEDNILTEFETLKMQNSSSPNTLHSIPPTNSSPAGRMTSPYTPGPPSSNAFTTFSATAFLASDIPATGGSRHSDPDSQLKRSTPTDKNDVPSPAYAPYSPDVFDYYF